ncbi:hypothetical protein [Mucilaginibacter myungsuensis]|uniref:Uncharacterized protein n=1 Tax=Mucilaginibacter myungsuensis TaxID=649104 RepID=A0A929PVQ2_9SPHI|nr:hypothetical protein [Mucilaginibacter myungsuensis]MBE9662013.1 hypothetical protein [Mucilaginibacter myungsuensis]MDN3599554.1 hypothetical protein [Mucilaginibacter myungsuensis]
MTRKIRTTTGWLAIAMPQQLSDITLGQLIAMQSADKLGDLDAVSILSGTPLADLQNILDVKDLEVFNADVASIAHQIKYLYNSDAIPKTVGFMIDGGKREVKVTNNLSMEPAGAYYASRELIADAIAKHIADHGEDDWQETFSPPLTVCAQILAQYFYCRATGKPYNEAAATEFEEQVRQLPITQALPICKYFFLNYPNLSKPRTSFWHRLLQRWSNARG